MNIYTLLFIILFSNQFVHANVNEAELKYFPMDIKDYSLLFVDTMEQVNNPSPNEKEFWPLNSYDKSLIQKFNERRKLNRDVDNFLVSPGKIDEYSKEKYPYLIKPVHVYNYSSGAAQLTSMTFQLLDRKTNRYYDIYESNSVRPAISYFKDLNKFIRLTENHPPEKVKEKIYGREKKNKIIGGAFFVLGIAAGPIIAVLLDL